MSPAFQMTPEWASVIGLVLTNVFAIVLAVLKARGHAEAAKALDVVIRGVEQAADDVASGKKSGADAAKDAIKTIATSEGVEDFLKVQVERATSKFDPKKIADEGAK